MDERPDAAATAWRGTDLGGNALVATAATDKPALSAEFLKFMVSADAMSAFCAATNELRPAST